VTRADVDPLRRWPVVVGRSTLMPGPAAERKMTRDLRAAVVTYLTEHAGEPAEVAVRAAELAVTDKLRPYTTVVHLTADQLAHYAGQATKEGDK
jgi:hypothetical protein